jgi:hypothetical protein
LGFSNLAPRAKEVVLGDQEFGRGGVAEAFPWVGSRLHVPEVEDPGLSDPQMRQLVREREHLRRLAIGPVDEDKWRVWVGQDKAAKFLRIELSASVVAHDTVDDDDDASELGAIAQRAQRIRPGAV